MTTSSFPAIAAAAQDVLTRAGNADDLLESLRPAFAREKAVLHRMLAERVQSGLTRANLAHGQRPLIEQVARKNCRTIADEIFKDDGFLPRLARWLSVNLAFWLWQGEGFAAIDGDSVGGLISLFIESQAEVVCDNFTPPKAPLRHLEEILGATIDPAVLPPGMMLALSAEPFRRLREALAKSGFERQPGADWPTASLGPGSRAQLRPPAADDAPKISMGSPNPFVETMWRLQGELSDRDADVLDALCGLYLSKAESADDAVVAAVDELLVLRGLRPKLGGGGRRGGFEREQRDEIQQALAHIQNVWIDVAAAHDGARTLQSRPFLITDRVGRTRADGSFEMERFLFRPGRAFAAFLFEGGRHLMFQKALQYDPYRRSWEKRLTRFFCWHWGEGNMGSAHAISTLLSVVGADDESAKSRARLDKAFVTLQADGIVANWHHLIAGPCPAIWVEPPPQLVSYYAGRTTSDDLAARLRNRRRTLGLTQAALSAQLGIGQSHLSKLEHNRTAPSPAHRQAIERWLATPSCSLSPCGRGPG